MESPIGYKPDSTISDTELERQQHYLQEEFYLSQWNNTILSSPKRPNLDDRLNRLLSDSPTQNVNANNMYQPDNYPYPMQHDNQNGMFYPEMYHGNHQMPPPSHHLQSQAFPPHQINHHGPYDEFNNFASPRNFVNNSNLVEITQQKRDRQRAASSQAVQVGNVLEIVPNNNKIVTSPETLKELDKSLLSSDQMRQQAEKRSQAKILRKVDRDRKRLAKNARKEKLRHDIQRYFDAGINVDHSDDEQLVPIRSVNLVAVPEKSIIKKSPKEARSRRKVLFRDGILPGETTSEDEGDDSNETSTVSKNRRQKFRKKRLLQLLRSQSMNCENDSSDILNDPELEKLPPPHPPDGNPPVHLKQPRLKKITIEMFAAFPVNAEPILYYIEKMQQANGFHQAIPPPRIYDRFHYYKKQPPPNVGRSPGYLQQQQIQRNAIPKQSNPGESKAAALCQCFSNIPQCFLNLCSIVVRSENQPTKSRGKIICLRLPLTI